MSRQGNLTLCVLWGDEIRKAAKLLTSAVEVVEKWQESGAQADHEVARTSVTEALIAAQIALNGADNDQAVLLLSDATMAQSHMVDAATELADSRDPDTLDKWQNMIGATVQYVPASKAEEERASLHRVAEGDQGKVVDLIWNGTSWHLQVLMNGGTFRADACHFERVEG